MKKFTIKDFILYNGPCFSCGKKITIQMVNIPVKHLGNSGTTLTINKNIIEVKLKIKYSFSLDLQLFINNNKFEVSDMEKFITYLGVKDLYLVSNCSKCNNMIISNILQFDSKGYIKAISLMNETIKIQNGNKSCSLFTEYSTNSTQLKVFEKNKVPLIMDLTLLTLYKFKTKEKLLNKINTYILFS